MNEFDELELAASVREEAKEVLETTIIRLVRQLYLLQLPAYYKPTSPDLEQLIIGKDQ